MQYKKLPPQQELLKLFSYNEKTGELFWKDSTAFKAKKGKRAGCKSRYIVVRIGGVLYPAHRVIYKMYNPNFDEEKEIDHIDQNKHNNSLCNLRVVDRIQNSRNKPKNKNNTSGYKGVTFCKITKTWSAQIKVDYKNIRLGRYKRIEDAVKARKNAEIKYGF